MIRKSILILIILFSFVSCINELSKKRIKSVEYRGTIVDIYQSWNHNVFSFLVNSENGEFQENAESWPYSWEYASIGDSIIKPPDTLMIIIKKPDGSGKEFFYR
jgi:hypothetical protein